LLFPYTPFPISHPLWPLHGRVERPRPVLLVSVLGPAGTAVEYGLLDTGSDDTVFPDFFAADIGLDLTNAPTGVAGGVGPAGPAALRYAEVLLRITDGREYREWTARVGFASVPLRRPLLGFAGFLQFFTAVFHGHLEQVELTVNPSYPGT
jgi:hypothetical protein